MIKYFPILIVALILDGIQMGISLSFLGVGSVASAAVAWIPFVGQAAAGGLVGAGSILGIIMNFCLTVTFGASIIVFLAFNRMFYPQLLFLGGTELIPMLNNLPGWSGFVLASMIKNYKIESKKAATAGNEEDSLQETQEMEEAEENLLEVSSARMEDIRAPRAANDNVSRERQKYAA